MIGFAYKTSPEPQFEGATSISDCAAKPADIVSPSTGATTIPAPNKSDISLCRTDKAFSKAQIALLVRNNIPVGDWDEYVHMRPCKGDDVCTRTEFLGNLQSSAERRMTHRMGQFFLWVGLGLMTVSSIGAILS